ncbi:MAG: hypothetical protein ACOYMN_19780 [Roseimicrobium sp.]
MSKSAQFVTDEKGKRVAVLLDVKTYERLCEADEELADIRAYDKAKPQIAVELQRGQFQTLTDYHRRKVSPAK